MRGLKIVFLLCIGTFFVLQDVNCEVFRGEPVQLLNVHANKTVTLTKGSLEKLFLDPLVSDREVVVISIAGALRKGKSFLLNYMLRYLYANYKSVSQPDKVINETTNDWIGDENEPLLGFSWKSSSKRETSGILFWSDVFIYDKPNGVRLAIYLVDTQGLFDHYSSPTDNIRIFSLSALMSSVQIMNLFNNIQESDLEFLQFATEIAQFTAVKEGDEEIRVFQKLFFLIRDWSSPDEYDYGLEGGMQFLKSFLSIKSFHTGELKKVREHIQKTFDTVEGFLMPHPGKVVTRNATFDGRYKLIDEDFVDLLQELIPHILAPKNLIVKTVNGVSVKAFEMSHYIRQYIDLFKSENLPEAKTIYETTMDNQVQLLIGKSIEIYLQSIQLYQDKINKMEEIVALHNISKSISLKYFDDEKKFGSDNENLVFRRELIDKIEKVFNEWKPITEELLNKIGNESEKQKALAEKAKKVDEEAKEEVILYQTNYQDIQRQLEKSRGDNAESRREAAYLRKKLQEIENQRNAAIEREQIARQEHEVLRQRALESEKRFLIARQEADQRIKQQVQVIRKRSNILQVIVNGAAQFVVYIQRSFERTFGNLDPFRLY